MLDSKALKKSLEQSAANRAAMTRRLGMVPLSILRLSRGSLSRRMFQYAGDGDTSVKVHNTNTAKRKRLAAISYKGAKASPSNSQSGGGGPVLSIMPAELVEFFIRYYAEPGDVYLDPFMGQGVQLQVAVLLGLHYYGYDLSEGFCEYIDSIIERLEIKSTIVQATHGDSRSPDEIPDGIGDFSFHSPPYWDTEDYGDDPRQLGTGKTYREFLDGMHDVAAAWLPKFKPGAWHIVNVNDFRKGGKFIPYHADLISTFCAAGWELHDTWIIDGLVGGLPRAFAVSSNNRRLAPKVHEYALVFVKP